MISRLVFRTGIVRHVTRFAPGFFLPGLLAAAVSAAGTASVPFTPDAWDLNQAEVTEHLGRTALRGVAWLRGVDFADGVIEVDIATDRGVCYPRIVFRRVESGDFEHVYFRPFRGVPFQDGIQYAPVFNGVVGWQLYSGPGFTAPLALPENQWVHVRLEVKGTQARVFVGEGATAALDIHELKRGLTRGAVGLESPRGSGFYFSRFSFTPRTDLQFDPPPRREPIPGLITTWQVSPVSRPNDLAAPAYLDGAALDQVKWEQVQTDAFGLLDLARHRAPVSKGASRVWLRATLRSDQKQVRPLAFGYSDDVWLFLNGRPLFRGRSGFQRREPSFLGIISWEDTVYLPLEPGDNELVLEVTDGFGGWGVMARYADAVYEAPGLSRVWERSDRFVAPEAVVYDADRQMLYVSNFTEDGFVSRVSAQGEILDSRWITGLGRPTGMALRGGRLYVVERAGVAEIDPVAGNIVGRWSVPEAGFLNDLAFDEEGDAYVTDTFGDRVYRLRRGKPEIWFAGSAVGGANGILVERERVLVGASSRGAIVAIDRKTRQATTIAALEPGAIIDGLVADERGGYLFSDYRGRIYRLDSAARKELLFDGSGPSRHCADFAYVPGQRLLVVPALYDHRVTAYRLAE